MTRVNNAIVKSIPLVIAVVIWGSFYAMSDDTPSSTAHRPEFAGWPKPDAVLMISGQQFGYIEPCGCTGLENQKGGLARRDTLLQSLKSRGWDVLPLDAGNQVRRIGNQAEVKYQFTIGALREMKYGAVGFGSDDLRLDIGEVLANITASVNEEGQSDLFVCANVNPFGFVASHRVIPIGGLRIGVTTVLGDAVVKKVTQPEIETRPAEEAVREAVNHLQNKQCDYIVCLAQADDEECRLLAKKVPGIDLIVASIGAGEPRFQPEVVPGTSTELIQTGLKGMYIGAVGLFKKEGQRRARYQRIPLDDRFQDSERMMARLAEYQQVLQTQGLEGLDLKPVRHIRGKFVGSETCADCHARSYDKWKRTPHHNATKSIAEPTQRSKIPRHFDPECLSCHVTGWNPQGFFPYETGYTDLLASKSLHGNGCENCHGPGHAHVAAENGDGDFSDEDILKLRRQMHLELSQAEQQCMECHDLDNSPNFHKEGAFDDYWKEIAHPWRD